MAFLFILLAASLATVTNYCMKRSMDQGGSLLSYLLIQSSLALAISVLVNPVRTGHYEWHTTMGIGGGLGGLFLGLMAFTLGKALEKGPSGLTVAFFNASSVMPAIFMGLFFGAAFGHAYTQWHALGSILVVFGLFWAGWQVGKTLNIAVWLFYTLTAFFLHALVLMCYQWRALHLQAHLSHPWLLSVSPANAATEWFQPMVFLASMVFQAFLFFKNPTRRSPTKREWMYGIMGGIANGGCTFYLMRATELATSIENAVLFPIYSITIILLCNVWGRMIYKEKINWWANTVCLMGLVTANVNWATLSF